jgi:hypothetical protein
MALSTRFHLLHSLQPRRLRRREGPLIEAFSHSGITFALLRRFQDPDWNGMALPVIAEKKGLSKSSA